MKSQLKSRRRPRDLESQPHMPDTTELSRTARAHRQLHFSVKDTTADHVQASQNLAIGLTHRLAAVQRQFRIAARSSHVSCRNMEEHEAV
jgi:hypothetical protein